MKKITKLFASAGIACCLPLTAGATPEDDLKEFQDFFKKRFPTVQLEDYSDGVNALPQYAERRANWERNLRRIYPERKITIIDLRESLDGPQNGDLYYDTIHLNRPGAEIFTDILARALNDHFARKK